MSLHCATVSLTAIPTALTSIVRHAYPSVHMIRNRRNRLATVLFALASLLFMHFAVAAYSCPGGVSMGIKGAEITLAAQAEMPCAESMPLTMDGEQPGLCHAHCQADPQSTDKYQVPGFVALANLGAAFALPRVARATRGAAVQAPLLSRTTAPPLAVRNCCFRI